MAEFRGFWKWFPVEFTYLIVGKYINLDCYRSNCEAEEKISLDVSIHEAEFVAYIVRCTGNVHNAAECDMYSEFGK